MSHFIPEIAHMAIARVVIVLCCCLSIQNLLADPSPSSEKRVALVIGNGSYQTGALQNPANDADDIASLLEDQCGFKVIRGKNLTLAEMYVKIDEFTEVAAAADVALFFFAGHGVGFHGENYLIPTDAVLTYEKELIYKSIKLDLILDRLPNNRSLKIIVLDCCRNNPLGRSFVRSSRGEGLSVVNPGTDATVVMFATAPGKTASDGVGERNSPFSAALKTELARSRAGLEGLFKSVGSTVLRTTNNEQRPWMNSNYYGEFKFNTVVAPEVVSPSPTPVIMSNQQALTYGLEIGRVEVKTTKLNPAFVSEIPPHSHMWVDSFDPEQGWKWDTRINPQIEITSRTGPSDQTSWTAGFKEGKLISTAYMYGSSHIDGFITARLMRDGESLIPREGNLDSIKTVIPLPALRLDFRLVISGSAGRLEFRSPGEQAYGKETIVVQRKEDELLVHRFRRPAP